jgi:hypothetical protein
MTGGVVAILLIAAAVWIVLRNRDLAAIFVIRIREGTARAVRGTVRTEFLSVISDLCGDHGIQKGEIRGVPHGQFVRLTFSRRLPQGFRQELRNWWASTR